MIRRAPLRSIATSFGPSLTTWAIAGAAASTTHSQLTEAEQRATGVEPGLVRLSVGLETLADILADLASVANIAYTIGATVLPQGTYTETLTFTITSK